ncbi:MAG TPA: urease accessory protein UreD [Nitrososphaeraceae archaeon]|jgi:urease accessory protein|nr:urease accessory protein UreD [Nitrososphaeraceae archaeon]
MSANFSTPQNIPPEIKQYLKGSENAVGGTGKTGILHLKFEKDSYSGNTIIKEQYSRVPLLAQRAMYLEESLPSMAYVYIVSPSGGILQGDRYQIEIKLGNNTYAHVTTQGATRIYKMEKNYASQTINIEVKEGGYFEYIPDQLIPFRNSRFYQEVILNVHDNATMMYSEVIVPGRVASGEAFEYDICFVKTICKNHLGKTRFIDTVNLEPKKENLRTNGILGNFLVVGTIYVVTKEPYVKDLRYNIDQKIRVLKYRAMVSCGSSILPGRQGIIIRILGNSAEDVKKMIFKVIMIVRKQIVGASFSGIRKS